MASDESPVIRHHSLRHFKTAGSLSGLNHHPSDNLISDEELSVGGTTPPPADVSPSSGLKDERNDNGLSDDEKDSTSSSAANIIKFSIDNILNPEFGNRMGESAAAVAFHHQQLIQHQQQQVSSAAGSAAAAAAAGSAFLGAFHQLPFLAAARQMILAAAAGNSIDYHSHHLAAHHAGSGQSHPLNGMLLAHQHHPTTLNLVESCTDKYLSGAHHKNWNSPLHQATPPGGGGGGASINSRSHPLSALVSAAGSAGTKSANNKTQSQQHHLTAKNQLPTHPAGSKAIDLSLRNSASPPDPVHRLTSSDKHSAAPQDSPSLASSADDNSSASPVRSVSVSFFFCFFF